MEQQKKTQTVIWAIDPFIKEKSLQRSAGKALRGLLGAGSAQVEPVYVLNTSPLHVPVSLSAEATARTIEAANRGVDALLRGAGLTSVRPVKVLSDAYSGLQGEVVALLRYARERKADLIVLSTHGRKGLSRWITGSFAETVMLSSPFPLLVVNPHWKTKADFRDVLFPTDFSPESKHAFERVLERVKERGGTVTIYHHIPYLAGPDVARTIKAMPTYSGMVDQILRDRQKTADEWAALAKTSGVRAKTIIDRKTTGSDSEAILKTLRRRPALVAMAARSGKVGSSILGSTTRQVLRGAVVPVWVVHESKVAHERKPLFELTQAELDRNLIEHESGSAA